MVRLQLCANFWQATHPVRRFPGRLAERLVPVWLQLIRDRCRLCLERVQGMRMRRGVLRIVSGEFCMRAALRCPVEKGAAPLPKKSVSPGRTRGEPNDLNAAC